MRFVALLCIAGCQAAPSLPWVHGFAERAASTGVDAPFAPAEDPSEGCGVGASRTIELVADVAPSAGRETIIASYQTGISVFDREDHLVASLPGYPCRGSADELEVVAAGSAYGEPLLALAATSGGRRETETFVALFRPGETLVPVFTGVVETRAGDKIARGGIYLVPDGLVYRRPGGGAALWLLEGGVYVPVLPETPHDEPHLVSLR